MIAELVAKWYDTYYNEVYTRNNDDDDGMRLVSRQPPTAEQLDEVEVLARQKAKENLAYAKRVLQVAFPDMQSEWRNLMSIMMSAVGRDYLLKASEEELANSCSLSDVEFREAFEMFELSGLTERIVYEPGVRAEDVGKFRVPLAAALGMFPQAPFD